jgi:AAA+ ATPase superfamily predicted ATPase
MNNMNPHSSCFGRKATLSLLTRRLNDLKEGYRQNLALLGSRYIGKSTVLQQFITEIDDDKVIAIYLNLENRDFDYFYSKIVRSILFNFAKSKNLTPQDDIKVLLEMTRSLIPETVEAIEKLSVSMKTKKFDEVYQGLLSLPEVFNNETDKFCIIFLDEFHDLEEFPVKEVFQELSNKIITQRRCLYIITSSYPEIATKILAEKLTLLFGNFEIINIGPFDGVTSQEFIEHSLGAINMGSHLRSFLADFTGGHPLYLSLICQELIHLSAVHKQNEVYVPLITQAIEDIVFNPWGALSRHFDLTVAELCQGKGNRAMTSLLIALAGGKNRVKDLLETLGQKSNQVNAKLNRLIELDIVEKNGNLFQFKDRLFRYWIKYVLQKRLLSVDLEPGKQYKLFREELNRAVVDFQATSRKDLSTRLTELFHCFDNECLNLNGRRYKLPVFSQITPLKLRSIAGNYIDVIQGECEEGTWLVALRKDPFTETDINTLLSEVKNLGNKPQRLVVVSLSHLDENVRVRALQERMWIWSEPEVNSLMHLYDKPYVVR